MVQLIIKEPGGARTAQLKGEITCVGRAAENQLPLRDTSLSRKHCEIRAAGDHFVLIDLGSRNGTLVNGVSIKEHRLEKGDKIEIGNSMIIFEAEVAGRDYRATPITSLPAHAAAASAAGGGGGAPGSGETARTTARKPADHVALGTADYLAWPRVANPMPVLIAVAAVLALGGGYWGVKAARAGSSGPAAAGSVLPLANASFEEAAPGGGGTVPGWEPRAGAKAAASRVEGTARTGKAALALELPKGEVSAAVAAAPLPVTAGRAYAATVWYRLEAAGGAFLELAWPGTAAAADRCAAAGAAAGEWARLDLVREAPEGATQVEVALGVYGAGKVLFDDVTLAPAKSEPLAARPRPVGPFAVEILPGRAFTVLRGQDPLLAEGAALLRRGDASLTHRFFGAAQVGTRPSPNGDRVTLSGRLPVPGAGGGFEDLALEFAPRGDALAVTFAPRAAKEDPDLARVVAFTLPGKGSARVRGTAGESELRERGEVAGVTLLLAGSGDAGLVIRYAPAATVRVEPTARGLRVEQWAVATEPGKGAGALTLSIAAGEAALAGVTSGASLASAKELEAAKASGPALAAYRAALKAGKPAPADVAEASARIRALERRGRQLLDDLKKKVDEAPSLEDPELCSTITREIEAYRKEFAGCEFADEAAALDAACAAAKTKMLAAQANAAAGRLLALARGFLAEQKTTLAAAYLREIVERFPGAETAAEARDLLAKFPPRR